MLWDIFGNFCIGYANLIVLVGTGNSHRRHFCLASLRGILSLTGAGDRDTASLLGLSAATKPPQFRSNDALTETVDDEYEEPLEGVEDDEDDLEDLVEGRADEEEIPRSPR